MSMICFSHIFGAVFTILVDLPLQNIDKAFIFPPPNKKKLNAPQPPPS